MPKKRDSKENVTPRIMKFLKVRRRMSSEDIGIMTDRSRNYIDRVTRGEESLVWRSTVLLANKLDMPVFMLIKLATEVPTTTKDGRDGYDKCYSYKGKRYCCRCGTQMIKSVSSLRYQCLGCSNSVEISS